MTEIRPQEGPQETFLSTSADIAFYGDAAGSGKTYALLLESTRHLHVNNFSAVCFRRERPQITNPGGLWDTSFDIYPHFGGQSCQSPKLYWRFPGRSTVTFSHIQHEKHLKGWDGSQVPLIMFDELQHFPEKFFFYMLSRNRSVTGVKSYMRGTCNPDPDSWLCGFLIKAGYINKVTGYSIQEMSGKIKYFYRDSGIIYWSDNRDDLIKEYGPKCRPKSFTYIMARLTDNKILLDINPDYESNLDAMLDYEKKRLKDGCWYARPTAGELFRRSYFKPIEFEDFNKLVKIESIRYWDRAATLPNDLNPDPDYTSGLLMTLCEDGYYYIVDIIRQRLNPGDVENLILSTVEQDNDDVVAGFEQEPGASGKFETHSYESKIKNRVVEIFPKTKNKLSCWKPLARAAKNGKVRIIKAAWNNIFYSEAESVTDGTQPGHDDQMDTAAGAFNYLELNDSQSAFYSIGISDII